MDQLFWQKKILQYNGGFAVIAAFEISCLPCPNACTPQTLTVDQTWKEDRDRRRNVMKKPVVLP